MSKIHKITKQKVKKKVLIQTVCFWKRYILQGQSHFGLSWKYCWTIKNDRSPIFAVDQLWYLNNGTRGGRIRPSERTFLLKETGRKSNMNLFAIREETKIFGLYLSFLSLPPRYLRCHILRLAFDLKIWNQAVPKQKSYFVKKMRRDHADILIIPAWIKPVENALKSGVNRSVSHWVLL